MFALFDASNFYAAVEQNFRPSLKGRPLVVLSNNDSCAIARSEEAKALGIKMGAPWFKISHLCESHGLLALSANFTLYGDMSSRLMSLIAGFGHSTYVYSIDEAFAGCDGIPGDLTERAFKVRARIAQWLGLECGVGLAQTLTLAKLANHVSKDALRKPGSYPAHLAQVCNFAALSADEQRAIMQATAVGDVWGVGRKIGAQLAEGGVLTAWDLSRLDPATVRRRWSLVLERTVHELRGLSCMSLEDVPTDKKQIAVTRSFGRPVSELEPLLEAVSEFASRAAEKLRKQGSFAGQLYVFAHSSPFRPPPQFSRGVVVPLLRPTADTSILVQAARAGVHRFYERGYQLQKAGVILLDLASSSVHQAELDLGDSGQDDQSHLMTTIDRINSRYGRGTVFVGGTGMGAEREWAAKQMRLTPQYTTRLKDIPVARA
ncbi:DNA-directed DNA polymerase [Acidovorax sp. NO-1]|uniref:Y-family DNA polymerase n=1 Tax=Acidovorax sp. NO-1 TaxID=512030 RepID=UPI00023FCD7E|nr:Y-family DNA polymerase [Acidovorax sp. NO-1]EHL24826.1 DNA-directed DNA polymerase [Acidovorax sp. NO-1]